MNGSIITIPATLVGNFGGGPYRGAPGHRVADDERLARAEMTNHRDDIGADNRGRVLGPIDARLAMAGKIHRDDAEAGGDQSRREESILLAHVAKAGNADDERAGAAGVVVGDLSAGEFQELRRRSRARGCLIGVDWKGRGDGESCGCERGDWLCVLIIIDI